MSLRKPNQPRVQPAPIGVGIGDENRQVDEAIRMARVSGTGSGAANEPPKPRGLAYESSTLSLTQGTRMTPLVPTLTEKPKDTRFAVSPALPNATVAAISLAPDPRAGILTPSNPTPIPYRQPEYLFPSGDQKLDVYLPAGTAPPNGWPVLISNRMAGWFGAGLRTQLDPANTAHLLLHKAVNAGIAVIDQALYGGGDANAPFFQAWIYPPGHPSGRWENPNQILPEWECLAAVQWVAEQSTYDLDPQRIFVHGVSAGATTPAWLAVMPELAFTSGSTHIQRPSALRGMVWFDGLFSFLACQTNFDHAGNHFESVSTPGFNAPYLGDADQEIVDAAGVSRAMLLPGSRAHQTPFFVACDEAAESLNYATESDGHPELRNIVGAPQVHDLWFSAALVQALRQQDPAFHEAKTEFWCRPEYHADLSTMASAVTGNFAGTLVNGAGGATALWDSVVAWMVARSEESFKDPNGLSFNPFNGCFYGTPNTAAGSAAYTVTASNANGETTTTVNVSVT